NGLAQRMVLPEVLGEDFINKVIRIVLIHFDFFQNHPSLAANLLAIKNRIERQVAEHIHGDGKMFVQHFDAKADTLLGGEGIHVAANRVNLASDLLGGTMARALEHHMLDEM